MDTRTLDTLSKRYPFISIVRYGTEEFVGLIQNRDDLVTSFYDFGQLQTRELKQLFLDLAEQWWYESSEQIPIHLFLRGEWHQFRSILRCFHTRELQLLHGPAVSLADLGRTRSKRRSITLVRKSQ